MTGCVVGFSLPPAGSTLTRTDFTSSTPPGSAAALPGGAEGVAQVMVSVEPAGGSEKPTTQPVVAATLS